MAKLRYYICFAKQSQARTSRSKTGHQLMAGVGEILVDGGRDLNPILVDLSVQGASMYAEPLSSSNNVAAL
jgi:hypothetical protein